MAPHLNSCLKRTFIFFNVLFAILGGIIIGFALLAQTLSRTHEGLEGRTQGLILLYIMGSVTMAIAILGAYGAHKENRVALIVFLVCMVVGSLLMLKTGVSTAISRPQFEEKLEQEFKALRPLDQSSESTQKMVNTLQTTFQCCGLFSYEDWGNNVPHSCDCDSEQEMEGRCQSIQYSYLFPSREKMIFRETCFPIFMRCVGMVLNIMLAVLFSLATLALLGMMLSSMMIHQMSQLVVRPTMVLTIPAVFTQHPPKYQELYSPPAY